MFSNNPFYIVCPCGQHYKGEAMRQVIRVEKRGDIITLFFACQRCGGNEMIEFTLFDFGAKFDFSCDNSIGGRAP